MLMSYHRGYRVQEVMMDVDTWDKTPIRIILCFSCFPVLTVENEKRAMWCCSWPIMQLFIVLMMGRFEFKHHKGRYYA